jgi:hypothetical protein
LPVSREERLSASACALLRRGDFTGADRRKPRPPAAAMAEPGNFRVPTHFSAIDRSGRLAGGHLRCWQSDSLPERGLRNRKGGFRTWRRM